MPKAKYDIHIPNTARRIAFAAHQYLDEGPIHGINSLTVHLGHPHDTLHVVGEESPELDSHIKQTATFIGDASNNPVINVTKQGKNIAHWPMYNPNYQPQIPAPPPLFNTRPTETMLPSTGPMTATAT